MSSNNFFDLTSGVDIFTIDSKVPAGFGVRALAGADSIVGSDRPDLVYGNDGADSIAGGIGNDSLQGGRGADLLLGNAGADFLQGERGNDVIYGGEDNDTLIGQEGDDFLAGGTGVDSLIGSDGSDAFVLNVADAVTNPALADTIADFSDEEGDVIALTDGAGDALTEADVTLEANGTDTFIRLKATGAILARVQGASPDRLKGLFSTAKATLDDTEPGATALGSIPGGANLQGSVGDEDYADFFQFEVKETSIVDLGLTGLSADADLLLYKDKNEDGELGGDEILSASERSDTANETIENLTLDRGKYFLSVEAYEGNTNYSLSLAGVAGTVARDLAGDRPSTARALPTDGEVELHDYVGGADAVDTYRLEVLNGGYLDLSTENRKADLNLTVWSDRNSNDRLDADEIVAQGTNGLQRDNIDPGTYYVNVAAPGTATPYEIVAISSPGSRVGIESYESLLPGIPTTGTLTQNDNFDPNDEENYADPYLVPELGAGLTVTVTQESEDFDAYLRVVDLVTGEVVAKNDDINTNGGDFNAQVSFTTEERKRYVVYASSVDAPGLGDYTLNTTVTGTPIESALRSASAGTLRPTDVMTFKMSDPGPKFDTIYQPLTGGQISPIRINNLNQGGIGDCFFLAALTSTFGKIKEDLSDAESKNNKFLTIEPSPDGTNYTVTFYNNQTNQPEKMTVDNQVLTMPAEVNDRGETKTLKPTVFGASWTEPKPLPKQASGQPIWASIFERAFAVWKGSYATITAGGDSGEALRWITGKRPDRLQWSDSKSPSYQLLPAKYYQPDTKNYSFPGDGPDMFDPNISKDQFFTTIQTTLNNGGYVVGGIPGTNGTVYNGVLYKGHAYSVHNAYEAEIETTDEKGSKKKQKQKLILLRNPHGVDNKSDSQAAEDKSGNPKDGFITIKFDAFLEHFTSLNLLKA